MIHVRGVGLVVEVALGEDAALDDGGLGGGLLADVELLHHLFHFFGG